MFDCYQRKILRINLTTKEIKTEFLENEIIKNYIGGDGFCGYKLLTELKSKIDPFSEHNMIIISTGPLTGTLWPTSGRFVMCAKSPLTNFWGESNCGGFFGPMLKFAGYDHIIITGKSEKPVYIEICNDDIKIKPANELWGKDTRETTLTLTQKNKEAQVLCIGQAGEKLVRYACVISNLYRALGRSGMGAVFGSKKLKAITVYGTNDIKVAQPDRFLELATLAHKRVIENPQAKQMFRYGTNLLVAYKQAIGELVTRNHSDGVFENAEKLYAEVLAEKYNGRPRACFGCSNACKEVYTTSPDNPWIPNQTLEGPEYEGTAFFGPNLGIDDFDFIMYAADLCNRYGIDQISCGAVISFVIECFEKGILTANELDGLQPRWGDKEVVLKLMDKIVKREGVGNILAEGVKRAAKYFGKGTDYYALHVKGQEISGQDGRTHRSVGLTHAVGARGADHLRSLVTVDQLGYKEAAIHRFGEDKLPEICNPYSETHKAYAVKITEDVFAIRDSLIVCWYTCGWPPIFWIDDFAQILPLATGFDGFGDKNHLMNIGEKIVNMKRMFNLREGLKPKDDTLPKRFLKDPMPSGPGKGNIVNLDIMLKEYYKLRGWDIKTGKISKKKLSELNLQNYL